MTSVENLVRELRTLTPDQLDRIALIVHEFNAAAPAESASDARTAASIAPSVLEQAVRNGWPAELFTGVTGCISDDFRRPPQIPHESRQSL